MSVVCVQKAQTHWIEIHPGPLAVGGLWHRHLRGSQHNCVTWRRGTPPPPHSPLRLPLNLEPEYCQGEAFAFNVFIETKCHHALCHESVFHAKRTNVSLYKQRKPGLKMKMALSKASPLCSLDYFLQLPEL